MACHETYFFIVAVAGDLPWPNEEVRLEYGGNQFCLVPPAQDRYGNVILEFPAGTVPIGGGLQQYDEQLTVVNRFLSVISWSYGCNLKVHKGRGCSRRKLIEGLSYSPIVQGVPNGMWLPEVVDAKAQRALGFMREARAAESMFPSVAFLWFYKAIEVCVGWQREKTAPFFNNIQHKLTVDSLRGYQAWAAKGPFKKAKSGQLLDTFGDYMREHLRNAVAHGFDPPSVDPDGESRLRELRQEMNLVRDLAEIAIQETFKVPSLLRLIEEGRKSNAPTGWVPLQRL